MNTFIGIFYFKIMIYELIQVTILFDFKSYKDNKASIGGNNKRLNESEIESQKFF